MQEGFAPEETRQAGRDEHRAHLLHDGAVEPLRNSGVLVSVVNRQLELNAASVEVSEELVGQILAATVDVERSYADPLVRLEPCLIRDVAAESLGLETHQVDRAKASCVVREANVVFSSTKSGDPRWPPGVRVHLAAKGHIITSWYIGFVTHPDVQYPWPD